MIRKLLNASLLLITATMSAQISPLGGGGVAPMAGPTNPPTAYNAIKFEYDSAGNQIKRQIVSLATGEEKPGSQNDNYSTKQISESYIQSEDYSDITFFPNPVKSELFVNWKESNVVDAVVLIDTNGKTLKTFSNQRNNKELQIDFSGYPGGFYLLNLNFLDGQIKTLRIVKQ